MEPKYCKDCKWFNEGDFIGDDDWEGQNREADACQHPSNFGEPDLVYGEPPILYSLHNQRIFPTLCGPEGKNYQAK